ncbi:M81 family metallopeptidase [[Clostridium] innocuum]|nr:M81 family metallopeptidase [[Clostridium] innocuum]
MKILAAKFVLEANAHVPMLCDLENVALSYGQDALTHMQLGNVFDADDIEVIPVLCADAACSGVMKKACFDYIEQRILTAVKEHLSELDGIYLHLHGASYVEEIGSGEHHLVRCIRELIGPYLPIAISCDPHGNLTKEYVESTAIIRSFREAPHTDIPETVQFVCKALVEEIRNRRHIQAIYRKLPLILGGEQSVSSDEPVHSINRFMNKLEEDERILSCSWHVGYLRHDAPEAGCGIVVVPSAEAYREYGEEVADTLMRYVWEKRHEFHYTGRTETPEKALQAALEFNGKPVFITDSGDNVTSGAMGANTFILRQVLACRELKKRILFVAINDPKAYQKLTAHEVNDSLCIRLGMDHDELTKAVELAITIRAFGRQEGTFMYGEEGDYGGLVTVDVRDMPVTIVVTENNHSFVEKHQIDACGVDWDDYDIIVVKQGYIHPEMKAKGKLCIMSLTDGATPQDTRLIPFKRIMRPMYPLDEI